MARSLSLSERSSSKRLTRCGAYYRHALDATVLLASFLKSADVTQEIFIRFLSQLKKHHTVEISTLSSTVALGWEKSLKNQVIKVHHGGLKIARSNPSGFDPRSPHHLAAVAFSRPTGCSG